MRITKLFAACFIAIMSLQACNKSDIEEEATIEVSTSTETINAVVEANKTYSVTLPPSASGYSIVKDASHFSKSMVVVSDNGSKVYQYTPSTDYTGADALTVMATDTVSGGNPPGGGCNKGGNNQSKPKQQVKQQQVQINISVTPASVSS